MPNLTHLRKVAEEATPGPWSAIPNHLHNRIMGPARTNPKPLVGTVVVRADAIHVATFDPPTVRLLLAALVEAKAMRAAAEPTTHHQACTRFDAALSRLEKEAGR